MNSLLYEDVPKYDFWLKLILSGVLALSFVSGVILIASDTGSALAMFGVTLFNALLLKAILPRRFQVFDDRLRILLGGPFAINIPFSNITDVKSASGRKVFAYWGIRFATSTQHVVEIIRKKGLNLIISPSHDDMFLDHLNRARNAMPKSALPEAI